MDSHNKRYSLRRGPSSRGALSGGRLQRGGRPQFGGSRGGNRGGGRKSGRIDISKFINKTVITEEAVVFTPEHLFKDFLIDERLKKNILTKGYNEPTPIQDRVIPHILQGHDVVGIANTGTGKTAAFLIPFINKVLKNPKEKVIIVAPTRELAQQIDEELKGFVKGFKIFSVCVVGGAPIGRQIADLRYFNNFIIGTPGRIKDLIERKCLNLAEFKSVVLDEADRML
ncbi:MAG: DNA/RNA helicase, superfamily II, partial [Parcubacteria group bacterium GW2011_GWA1_47_8]